MVASSRRAFSRSVIELLLIRSMAEPVVPWLPNELMFEIFRALFDLYDKQP